MKITIMVIVFSLICTVSYAEQNWSQVKVGDKTYNCWDYGNGMISCS